jgi:hypothetical protein
MNRNVATQRKKHPERRMPSMKATTFVMILVVVFSSLAFAQSALAYLDPASGSMILQLLLGGIAGVLVVLKLYWRRVKTLFLGLIGHKAKAD